MGCRAEVIYATSRTFLVVQWLRCCAATAEGVGSIPDWRTKIPQALQCGQKENKQTKKHPVLLPGPGSKLLSHHLPSPSFLLPLSPSLPSSSPSPWMDAEVSVEDFEGLGAQGDQWRGGVWEPEDCIVHSISSQTLTPLDCDLGRNKACIC